MHVVAGLPVGPRTENNNIAEWSAFVPRCQGIVSMELTALDMCYVAAGRFDVYWESDLAIWDITAGALICRGSGRTRDGLRGSDSRAEFTRSRPRLATAHCTPN